MENKKVHQEPWSSKRVSSRRSRLLYQEPWSSKRVSSRRSRLLFLSSLECATASSCEVTRLRQKPGLLRKFFYLVAEAYLLFDGQMSSKLCWWRSVSMKFGSYIPPFWYICVCYCDRMEPEHWIVLIVNSHTPLGHRHVPLAFADFNNSIVILHFIIFH
jgi:hypothetical protein